MCQDTLKKHGYSITSSEQETFYQFKSKITLILQTLLNEYGKTDKDGEDKE